MFVCAARVRVRTHMWPGACAHTWARRCAAHGPHAPSKARTRHAACASWRARRARRGNPRRFQARPSNLWFSQSWVVQPHLAALSGCLLDKSRASRRGRTLWAVPRAYAGACLAALFELWRLRTPCSPPPAELRGCQPQAGAAPHPRALPAHHHCGRALSL